jgi:nucleoid-associated protein YgaU
LSVVGLKLSVVPDPWTPSLFLPAWSRFPPCPATRRPWPTTWSRPCAASGFRRTWTKPATPSAPFTQTGVQPAAQASSQPAQQPSGGAEKKAEEKKADEKKDDPAKLPAEAPKAPESAKKAVAFKKPGVAYKIKWGDTLWDLSYAYYRDPWVYMRIAKANKIKNPDLIICGNKLWIPAK